MTIYITNFFKRQRMKNLQSNDIHSGINLEQSILPVFFCHVRWKTFSDLHCLEFVLTDAFGFVLSPYCRSKYKMA
jgi:hypothetical protein